MSSHAMRRLVRPVGRGGRVLIVSLGFLALLTVAFTPAHAAQLTLTWSDASTNEDGFTLERKTGTTGAYGQLASLPAGTTGYVDAAVTAGTTYCYRVRAYNSAGDSAYSNEACAAPASATFYTVTVGKAGAGSGTVSSSPSAIDCGNTCNANIANGTSLALSATPVTGSTFSGWSGACTGTGNCALVVDNNKSLTATFALSTPTTYTLTLSKSGSGSGTVTSVPSGITCGSDCTENYTSGTSVTLTAAASTGATFTGWSGACTGTGATCTVSMTAARSVTAAFTTQTYALIVTKSGTGSGTVTSNPSGVNCGADCTENYTYNTSVTLTAAPASGSTFAGWSGACNGTGPCTVTVDGAKSVTASFALAAYTLTVGEADTGSGTVTSSPTGINCGSTCSASFNAGTSVTLTAAPATGFTFAGWSGACTGTGSCTVTMNVARAVTATFAVAPLPSAYMLSVTKNGAGTGIVASNPAGINCGTACSASFGSGTGVTLQAMPEAGSTFTGWSGACTGTDACTVAMNQAQSVTATFALQSFPLSLSTSGTGRVTSSPSGIDCGSDCAESYSYNTRVTLTATAAPGSAFTGWSGACSGTGATCAVIMAGAKSVMATFDTTTTTTTSTQTPYTLTVRTDGNAKGTVTSDPGGIACGRDCSESYAAGTRVTLTATPAPGAIFTGWSGACAGTGTCTVTLNQSTSATASFKKARR